MTNEQELNKKLAEWTGFKQLPRGRTGWHYELCEKVMNWMPPDKIGQATWYSVHKLPDFTKSLDACFKWLVPRASEDGYEIAISTEGKDYYGELFSQGQGDHFQAKAEIPSLALCLAIEKLIDGEAKE